MRFANIEAIKAHQFTGNHFSDHEAFNAIEVFVSDGSNTIADRAEAIRTMCHDGMGLGRDEDIADHKLVTTYLELAGM